MANYYTNNALDRRHFEDLPTEAIPDRLIYSGSGYITASIAASSATQRIGAVKISNADLVVSRSYEALGIGGNRIGGVVVFENGEPLEQVDQAYFDANREGKNIVFFKDYANVPKIKPIIRVSPTSFYQDSENEIMNHFGDFEGYGFGKEYLTLDENEQLIPFKDFSKLVPKSLVGTPSTSGYPIVHDARENFVQYLDPSSTGLNGAIDFFGTRRSLADNSFDDINVKGMFGSLQGGGIDGSKKGSTLIDDKREFDSGRNEMFLDSQEVQFSDIRFPLVGVSGSASNYLLAQEGFLKDDRYVSPPFKEEIAYFTGSYDFKSNVSLESFLSGSRRTVSEVGSRFKSSTCGLVFGESNVLGTDSIAFGGMKK